MKAVILAAGNGERASPYSLTRPKAMFPVANKPIIHHTISQLKEVGVRDFVVVIGRLGERIVNYLGSGEKLGINISYVTQATSNGTSKALALVKNELKEEDELIVVYGDTLTTKRTFKDLVEAFRQSGAIATVAAKEGDAIHNFGIEAKGNEVHSIVWRPRDLNLRAYGIIAMKNKFLDYVERNPGIMLNVPVGIMPPLEGELFQSINDAVKNGESITFSRVEDFIVDVDYPWNIIEANVSMLKNMSTELTSSQISPSAKVSQSAQINGNIVVGENSRIGDNVYIEGPVWIGKNSIIDRGAIILGPSVVGDNTVVSNYSLVQGVLGNEVRVENAAEVFGIVFDGVYIVHYSEIAGIVGERTDIGAATVCGTLRFDDEKTIVEVKGKKLVGENVAFIGDYCRTGVNAILMPGVRIGPYSIVGPGVILYEDLEPYKIVLAKQELVKKDWGPNKYGW
ncbi:MAG: sugar phosphate nucleotidyltransferase [Thermoproteota archaeon]|jgi:bifunctional UDP-N-acetylglucosamine pyrophosphorylase/glucosamine-1-phosphate N-acetyltransferase